MNAEQVNGMLFRAAALSLTAGVLHLLATVQYLPWRPEPAICLVVAAMAQLIYGVLLILRFWRYDDGGRQLPTDTPAARPTYRAGIVGNGALIVLFLIVHTVAAPFASAPEPPTLLGLIVVLAELALLTHLHLLLRNVTALVRTKRAIV
jgi:hypothetical protein